MQDSMTVLQEEKTFSPFLFSLELCLKFLKYFVISHMIGQIDFF